MNTLLTIFSVLAAAFAGGAGALIYIHHRRFERCWEELKEETLKSGMAVADIVELKEFYEFMAGNIKEQLEEAHRAKDRAKIQNIQRMKERLETFKARTIDRPVRKSQELAEGTRESGKRRPKRGK